jgi:hypothetical protein
VEVIIAPPRSKTGFEGERKSLIFMNKAEVELLYIWEENTFPYSSVLLCSVTWACELKYKTH